MKANWKKTLKDAGCWLSNNRMKNEIIVDKCKVMYMGKIILHNRWWSWLVITMQKQDLGVIIDSSRKMSVQCSVAIEKVNWMLGIIKGRIEKKKKAGGGEGKNKGKKTVLYKHCKNPWCAPFSTTCAILPFTSRRMICYNYKHTKKREWVINSIHATIT